MEKSTAFLTHYYCVCSVAQSRSATPWTAAARLLCPQDISDKNTGVGCHALLQSIFPTHGLCKYRQINSKIYTEDFAGSPVLKTPHFHCRGHTFHALVKALRFCMPYGVYPPPTKLKSKIYMERTGHRIAKTIIKISK